MKELDKTKQNIRINEIDDGQRKDLFNKFKDAGGQVLSEKEKKRNLIIDRDKQKQHQQRLDTHYSSKPNSSTVKKAAAPKKNLSNIQSKASPFEKFRIRMRLRILGITGFNTVFLKKTFFQNFNEYYKPSLIEIQMIYLALFKKDPKTGNKIIRSLDKISPVYYELIEKAGNLYEPYLINNILEGYFNFSDVPQPISELRDSFNELFRMLFILKPYENSIYNSFDKSIDMSITYNEGKKDKNIRKKDLKNSLFVIFNKLYPRLHTLFCYYQNALFTESDRLIEDILSITQADKPGNRSRTDDNRSEKLNDTSEQNETDETAGSSDDTSDVVILSDAVKEGLKMMYRLDNKTLRALYDKKGEFELLHDTDKILLTYMLFLEFEKEYSFILTTNKIKYNVDFSTNVKIDYKARMQEFFNQLNKCQEAFRIYFDSYQEYNKIYNQKPMSSNQYIAYSKRLDEVSKKKNQSGFHSRLIIKAFMDNLASELKNLIEDMNGKQRFISNPQDVLEFSFDIEGDKKLKNKKVFEAIETVFNYASALSYRIDSDGDLSGKLEFDENDSQLKVEEQKSPDEKNREKGESIFDELDDII